MLMESLRPRMKGIETLASRFDFPFIFCPSPSLHKYILNSSSFLLFLCFYFRCSVFFYLCIFFSVPVCSLRSLHLIPPRVLCVTTCLGWLHLTVYILSSSYGTGLSWKKRRKEQGGLLLSQAVERSVFFSVGRFSVFERLKGTRNGAF